MLDFVKNDIPYQLKGNFLLNVSIHSFETCSSQLFHILKVRLLNSELTRWLEKHEVTMAQKYRISFTLNSFSVN